MFEGITGFFKKIIKTEQSLEESSKDTAKERLHLVLMQDRANVSADFLDLMKQEIIDVIKKYIEVDEKSIDVRLTNQSNDDGTNGAPALYANIPIVNIKNECASDKEEEEKTETEVTEEKVKETKKSKKKTKTKEEKTDDEQETAEVVVRFADDEEEKKEEVKDESTEN